MQEHVYVLGHVVRRSNFDFSGRNRIFSQRRVRANQNAREADNKKSRVTALRVWDDDSRVARYLHEMKARFGPVS